MRAGAGVSAPPPSCEHGLVGASRVGGATVGTSAEAYPVGGSAPFAPGIFWTRASPGVSPQAEGAGQCHSLAEPHAERGRGVAFPRGAGTRVCQSTGASPSTATPPSVGTQPSFCEDKRTQPVPSRSRGQRMVAVQPEAAFAPVAAVWPPGSYRRTFIRGCRPSAPFQEGDRCACRTFCSFQTKSACGRSARSSWPRRHGRPGFFSRVASIGHLPMRSTREHFAAPGGAHDL
ncbi:uncharacterized protein LOC130705960 [Balaenoptera acutorostrata]|uniref:Uncharacterized protein LOC130705960 n=1 Tax=Balaenoptera acutorostrata TaxID=9767 RepID=A0ABM3SRQ1_BALAC|nr:uncharacterized protein LOC130705960 [Balaenoptera acutorostrata]XP_057392522.1 uncharacterized protein LOC130705960 [Balaenoptera acutorostrata]